MTPPLLDYSDPGAQELDRLADGLADAALVLRAHAADPYEDDPDRGDLTDLADELAAAVATVRAAVHRRAARAGAYLVAEQGDPYERRQQ